MNDRKLHILAALTAGVILVQGVRAATQGTLGATSTATIVVRVIVPPQFRLSGLQNFALGTYSGSGAMTANHDLCVYTNGTGSYRVRATDSSGMTPAAFAVQNATATADIPFILRWNDQTGTAGNVLLNYNATRGGTGANTQSADCSIGGNSANLLIRFTQANLRAAPGGVYSTTVTVTIEP